MNYLDQMIAWENGELSQDETVTLFQHLIDTGQAWHLQGMYGRTAYELIELGHCTLGRRPQSDAYGNHVPSRTQVAPGTRGSAGYQQAKTH